jgi:hypothetical protein
MVTFLGGLGHETTDFDDYNSNRTHLIGTGANMTTACASVFMNQSVAANAFRSWPILGAR